MAILGVLLGITSTILAGAIWFAIRFVRREHRYLRDLNHACTLDHQRIAAIEDTENSNASDWDKNIARIDTALAELDAKLAAADIRFTSTEKSIKSIAEPKSYRPRTWNEDTAQAEVK